MNALLRLLRIAPDPEPDLSFDVPARPHVAGRGSGEAVGPKDTPTLALVKDALGGGVTMSLNGKSLDGPVWTMDARTVSRPLKYNDPSPPMAGRDDPTPIFDAVMNDTWWYAGAYHGEIDHALEHQFAVSFILDEDRAEMAGSGELPGWLAGIDRDVSDAVQFGWER